MLADAGFVEDLSQLLCGVAFLLWMLVATLSRTDRSEDIVQYTMVAVCLAATFSLSWLAMIDGSMWGSSFLPKPLAVLSLVFAIVSRINIKGRNISQGANPHSIRRMKEDSEE